MPTEVSTKRKVRGRLRSSHVVLRASEKSEIDKLLDRADALQTSVEALEFRRYAIWLSFFVIGGMVGVLVTGSVAGFGSWSHISVALLAVMLTGMASIASYAGTRVRHQLQRDRRSLDALVDLLWQLDRTVSGALQDPLARAEFRIRMARFRIGPESSLTLAVRKEAFGPRAVPDSATQQDAPETKLSRPREEATSSS